MDSIVEYDLGNDLKLRVAGSSRESGFGFPEGGGGRKLRGPRELIQAAGQSFDDAVAQIGPAAETIIDRLKVASPSEIVLEFGLKLEAEAGAIVTKAGGEAHFQVTVTWKAKP